MAARVLVVANRTACTQQLQDAVRARAAQGEATFLLVVPAAAHGLDRFADPEDHGNEEARATLGQALPLLAAAGTHVEGKIGAHEPLSAIEDAVNIDGADEIIISTLPGRVSKWLRVDLVSKARGLGLPVTHVEAADTGQD